jgi:NAD(P)H-flavin reductase
MLQIARYSLFNLGDPSKFSLICANVNEDNILLRIELDYLVAMFPYRFKVYYVLNNPLAGWKGGAGYMKRAHPRVPPWFVQDSPLRCVCYDTDIIHGTVFSIDIYRSSVP